MIVVVAFSSLARILGECLTINSPPALVKKKLFKVEISSRTLIPLIRPGSVHSNSASWDDCNCVFFEELRVSSFPPTLCLDSGIVSSLRLRWVKDVCMFRCNLPPALLTEWPGSLTCHCGNTGVERTPNKSQHRKLTLEKKIPPPLLRDLNSHRINHEFGALPTSYPGTQQKYIFQLNKPDSEKQKQKQNKQKTITHH